MSEGMALLALAITTIVWGYMMFSKHPEITKHRNNTQKVIYTVIYALILWLINENS